jgi:hypothetical protein
LVHVARGRLAVTRDCQGRPLRAWVEARHASAVTWRWRA